MTATQIWWSLILLIDSHEHGHEALRADTEYRENIAV